jgi:type VI protein secretion system component VasF
MTTRLEEANNTVDDRQLHAALVKMPEAEVARLLNTVQALQVDLLRLNHLLNGDEPIETKTYAQDLLKTFDDRISRVSTVKVV